jgi:hypothetical protein
MNSCPLVALLHTCIVANDTHTLYFAAAEYYLAELFNMGHALGPGVCVLSIPSTCGILKKK